MSATDLRNKTDVNQEAIEVSTERVCQAYKTMSGNMGNKAGEGTTTERSALLQFAMDSSCICGQNACISCGEPIADRLQKVMDYVVRIGPHNDMITSQSNKEELKRVTKLMHQIDLAWKIQAGTGMPRERVGDAKKNFINAIMKLNENYTKADVRFDVCHAALIRISSYAFKYYTDRIPKDNVIILIKWIQKCIEAEMITEEWAVSVSQGRLELLIEHGTGMVGNMLYQMASKERQTGLYSDVVKSVLELACCIMRRLFQEMPSTRNISLSAAQAEAYGQGAKTAAFSLLDLLKLLRKHLDLYSSLQHSSFPYERVPAVRQFMETELRKALLNNPYGLLEKYDIFLRSMRDRLPVPPRTPFRTPELTRLLHDVSAELAAGADYVLEAVEATRNAHARRGQEFDMKAASLYFTTGVNS